MIKVLITGANSFVGTNYLICSKFKNVEEVSLFVSKPENIDFGKYDVVLHLAAIVHQSRKFPDCEHYKINRDLCLRVAENAKRAGIKQFIFLSTVKVYGKFIPKSGIYNEKSKCIPDDAYGKSKYEAELGLLKMEDVNFTVSIVRTPLVYGEGVKANMLRIVKLVEAFPILPFGKVNNNRSITYVENLVAYIDQIIEKRIGGIFIAKDENAISTTELINHLSKHLGRGIALFKLPQVFIQVGSFFNKGIFDRLYGSLEFDNSITKKELNFEPPFSTEEGFKKMINSYMKKGNS
jgi:nucleoside-diphosphate-sugar epimerase